MAQGTEHLLYHYKWQGAGIEKDVYFIWNVPLMNTVSQARRSQIVNQAGLNWWLHQTIAKYSLLGRLPFCYFLLFCIAKFIWNGPGNTIVTFSWWRDHVRLLRRLAFKCRKYLKKGSRKNQSDKDIKISEKNSVTWELLMLLTLLNYFLLTW